VNSTWERILSWEAGNFGALHPVEVEARRSGMTLTLPQLIGLRNNQTVIDAFMVDAWVKESGSVIHVVPATDAQVLSALISVLAKKYPLATVPILAAWICGESLFDHLAQNPNNQEAAEKPNVFERTDYGLVQVDGLYMSGHHDMAGLTQSQMINCAFATSWAAEDLAITATDLLTWGATLTQEQCGRYSQQQVAFNAYNKGKQGTLALIAAGTPLIYGPGLEARVTQFESLLG
jgi:hypothetical protein